MASAPSTASWRRLTESAVPILSHSETREGRHECERGSAPPARTRGHHRGGPPLRLWRPAPREIPEPQHCLRGARRPASRPTVGVRRAPSVPGSHRSPLRRCRNGGGADPRRRSPGHAPPIPYGASPNRLRRPVRPRRLPQKRTPASTPLVKLHRNPGPKAPRGSSLSPALASSRAPSLRCEAEEAAHPVEILVSEHCWEPPGPRRTPTISWRRPAPLST
jgi:hypothetical protein